MAREKFTSHVEPHLDQITKWAREGKFDKDIAAALGVSPQVFSEYRTKYAELDEALKRGRKTALVAVENALFEKALPHKRKKQWTESKKGKRGEVYTVTHSEVEEVGGDSTAAIFLLKSWDPDRYREKQDLNVNVAPVEIVDDIREAMSNRDKAREDDD